MFPFSKMEIAQYFSTKGDFAPGRHLATSADIFDCHTAGDTTGSSWVEARDASTLLQDI